MFTTFVGKSKVIPAKPHEFVTIGNLRPLGQLHEVNMLLAIWFSRGICFLGAPCCGTRAKPKRTKTWSQGSRCKVGPLQSPVRAVGSHNSKRNRGEIPPQLVTHLFHLEVAAAYDAEIIPPPFKLGKSQKIPPTLTFTQQQQQQQQTPKANGPSPRFGPPISSPWGFQTLDNIQCLPAIYWMKPSRPPPQTTGTFGAHRSVGGCRVLGGTKIGPSQKKNRV